MTTVIRAKAKAIVKARRRSDAHGRAAGTKGGASDYASTDCKARSCDSIPNVRNAIANDATIKEVKDAMAKLSRNNDELSKEVGRLHQEM